MLLLLNLPTEIRCMIWQELVCSFRPIKCTARDLRGVSYERFHTSNSPRKTRSQTSHSDGLSTMDAGHLKMEGHRDALSYGEYGKFAYRRTYKAGLHLSLLYVNKQVNVEASELLYRKNTLYVDLHDMMDHIFFKPHRRIETRSHAQGLGRGGQDAGVMSLEAFRRFGKLELVASDDHTWWRERSTPGERCLHESLRAWGEKKGTDGRWHHDRKMVTIVYTSTSWTPHLEFESATFYRGLCTPPALNLIKKLRTTHKLEVKARFEGILDDGWEVREEEVREEDMPELIAGPFEGKRSVRSVAAMETLLRKLESM